MFVGGGVNKKNDVSEGSSCNENNARFTARGVCRLSFRLYDLRWPSSSRTVVVPGRRGRRLRSATLTAQLSSSSQRSRRYFCREPAPAVVVV